MTNRNTRNGKQMLLLTALIFLVGFRDGLAENQGVEQLRRSAEEGNIEAQLKLGNEYRSGWNVPKDYREAVRWYQKAAEQSSKYAQVKLGMMYYFGQEVPRNPRKAIKWLRMAAEQKAYLYFRGAVFSDAFIEDMLASLYESGEGVQDYRKAVKWYRKASARGYAPAQRSLGDMYYRGKGVPQHYREALRWFRLAAEQGDVPAQMLLGEMYARGRGVPQDYAQAYVWLNLAAIEGDSAGREARRLRESVAAEMSPEQVVEAQRVSVELLKRIKDSKSQ